MTEKTIDRKGYNIASRAADDCFKPFVINLRIDSKETAENIIKLLEPITYAGGTMIPAYTLRLNKEQRQWAEDISNLIAENSYRL